MASIQPFRAIRPNPAYKHVLVTTADQSSSVAGEPLDATGLPVLKFALEEQVSAQRTPGTQRSGQSIHEALLRLLKGNQLVQEERPAIYVYEVLRPGCRQRGVWALTDLRDYLEGRIRTHENTFAEVVDSICAFRDHSWLDCSPVLLTYRSSGRINELIERAVLCGSFATIRDHNASHSIWKIDQEALILEFCNEFARIRPVYLADGHHRLAAAAKQARVGLKRPQPAFGVFSSLYMAADQLRVREFHRLVFPDETDPNKILAAIGSRFDIIRRGKPALPLQGDRFMMYLSGNWFELSGRGITSGPLESRLGAELLQHHLLAPVFGIKDPVRDPRLVCVGGPQAFRKIRKLLQAHPGAVAFLLCPLTADDLMRVADADRALPPKSTWIDPKVPFGLLIYQKEDGGKSWRTD